MKNKEYYTVGTKWKTKNTTLSEQNEKQKYYIVGKQKQNGKQKNTTLSEQNEKKIPFCLNIKKRKKNTLSEKLYCWSKMKNKNDTLSEQNEQQKQKILYCKNRMKNKKNTMLPEQN